MLRNAKNAKNDYFELSSRGDMEPPLELDTASSSDEPVDLSNCIHVEDHKASIANIQNDHRLTQLGNEKRMQEKMQNTTMTFKKGFQEMSGERDIQIIQQQHIIDDMLANQIPPPYLFERERQNPFHKDNI